MQSCLRSNQCRSIENLIGPCIVLVSIIQSYKDRLLNIYRHVAVQTELQTNVFQTSITWWVSQEYCGIGTIVCYNIHFYIMTPTYCIKQYTTNNMYFDD